MKLKKWVYALGLLTLSINFLIYLVFLIAAWGENSPILDYSLAFLFVNSFLVIPLGFPLYFPFGVSKKIKYRLVDDVSALKNFVFMTKIAQFAYLGLTKLLWGIAIIAFPISITDYFFGNGNLISSIAYPMAFSLLGTSLLLLHTIPFAALTGYSSLWSTLIKGKRSFNERISEARMFLLFSKKLLEKNYKGGITLLAKALLVLNKAIIIEGMWTTPRRMKNLDAALVMLETIENTDHSESKKGMITNFNEKISALINKKKLYDLPSTLTNFVEQKELESFKGFSPRSKIEISNRFLNILVITLAAFLALVSAAFLKILEIVVSEYPQLLVFVGTTSVSLILSYLFIFRNPAIPYPLTSDVLSALSKKI